jgi:hypothetical protein
MSSRTTRRSGRFSRRIGMFLVILSGSALSFALGNAAWSYFTTHGTGGASAITATLNPPDNVVATFPNPSQRTANLWDTPVEPSGVALDGYYVTRYLGSTPSPACGTSPTVLTTILSCQDTNVASNSYTYSVTAVFRSWSSTATGTIVVVPAPVLASLNLDVFTPTSVAGANTNLGIIAYDQYGAVFTGYNGPECLNFSGPANDPNGQAPSYTNAGTCSGGNIVEFANGVGSANVTLFDAQTTSLNATDVPSGVIGSTTLSVAPGTLQSLTVVPQTSTPVAGTPFSTDLTGFDKYGNLDTNYSGSECISFSGPFASPIGTSPSYPALGSCGTGSAVTFAAGSATGANAPSIMLFDAVAGVLDAQDVLSSASGSAGLTVAPAGPKAFVLGAASTQGAGTSFPVSITTLDQYGNVDTNYSGSQCITFSGASNAPDGTGATFGTAGSCLTGNQVTFASGLAVGSDVVPVTLLDAQSLSLVATDPSSGATGALNLAVGPANLESFTLTPSDSSPVAGSAFTVGMTALDQYKNVDTNYTGNQCIAFSGASNAPDGTVAGYPASGSCLSGGSQITFTGGLATAGDAPSITLYDSQPVDLLATDVPSLHFGSTTITVNPGTLHSFAVVPDSTTQTAGTVFNVRLTALDPFKNVDTNFTGPQCVTFSGPDNAPNGASPTYPAPGICATDSSAVTFVNGYVAGPNILSVTLFDAETADLTATLTTGTQTGSQSITVNASPVIAGIGITGITLNTTPLLSCGGGVGSTTCSSMGESASSGNVLTASILEDQYGNATANATANPLLIDIQVTGAGNTVPGGSGALSVSIGQSMSSSTFTLTRDSGTGHTVVATATLENTSPAQTLTITLGS